MKRLVLIRHAKSSWKEVGVTDIDRKLNKRGKRDAPFMAGKLGEKEQTPDVILSSPAKRARKTAECMAEGVGYPKKRIRFEEDGYTFSAGEVLHLLRQVEDSCRSLFFVGHNYGLTDLAEQLTGQPLGNVPTSGIVGMECNINSWKQLAARCATLQYFDYPKKERDNAELL